MTTWILVLSIMGGSGAAAITTVEGFNSELTCNSAGKIWLSKVKRPSYQLVSAVCIPKK